MLSHVHLKLLRVKTHRLRTPHDCKHTSSVSHVLKIHPVYNVKTSAADLEVLHHERIGHLEPSVMQAELCQLMCFRSEQGTTHCGRGAAPGARAGFRTHRVPSLWTAAPWTAMAFGCHSSRSFLLPVCLFHDLLQTGDFEAWRC